MAAIAVLKTLEHAWKSLAPLQLPMAVMGGLALSLWRYPRATRDVDLLAGIGANSPDELLERLRVAGFRCKHTPPVRQLGAMRIVQLEFDPKDAFVSISVDLLLVDSDYHREALRRRIPARLESIAAGVAVWGGWFDPRIAWPGPQPETGCPIHESDQTSPPPTY